MKKLIQKTFYPMGSVAKIFRGPLKGYKFIISENSGWSPILGRWEPESQKIFDGIIKKGQVIYDLGANNGIHTLLFAKLTGPDGVVFSFEPIKDNIDEIQKNCQLNNIKNVKLVPMAVSDRSGTTKFKIGLHNKQGSLHGIGRENGKEIDVTTTSLDDFIASGNPAPHFLKIDIEGAESIALKGFEKNFDRIKPTIIVELHTKEQDELVGGFFKKHNYKVYRIKKDHWNDELSLPHLEKVKNLDKTYPDPDGIWGTVLGFHPQTQLK